MTKPKFRYVIDGIGYPSVTEILKTIPKPQLQKWREVTPNADIISRDRATIGTVIHWRIHRYFSRKNNIPPAPFKVDDLTVINHDTENCEKGFEGNCYICHRKAKMMLAIHTIWIHFETFMENHYVEPIQVEKIVCNTEIGYAGTLDFYGHMDGLPVIIDWKTAKAIYPDHIYGAQLSAYKRSFKNKAEKLIIVRMNEETGYEVAEVSDDWNMFLEAMEKYKEIKPDRLAQKV